MQASHTLERCHTATTLQSCTCEGSALSNESGSTSLSLRDYGTCFQGFLLGLCVEGALALCLYGVYYVSHGAR